MLCDQMTSATSGDKWRVHLLLNFYLPPGWRQKICFHDFLGTTYLRWITDWSFLFLLFQWIQRNYVRRLFGNENNVVFPRNSCKVNTSTSAICNGWVNSKVEQKWRGLLSVPISCTNPILSLPNLNHATVQTMKGWSVSLMARID